MEQSRVERRLDFYRRILTRVYPGYKYTWDIYSGRLGELARESHAWLDAGCGRNHVIGEFKTSCAVGIDLEVAAGLESRERFVRGDLGKLPFRIGAFDLVTANFVVEHLDNPVLVFREISRVLKPGGHLLIRTTNLLNYFFFAASFLPVRIKRSIVRTLYGGHTPVHKTRYRLNTPSALRGIARTSGLEMEDMIMNESLHFLHPPLFAISLLVERILSIGPLANFKNTVIATYRKPR